MKKRVVEETLNKIKTLLPDIDNVVVDQVVMGLGYTGVKLSSGHSGLCYTFQSDIAQTTHHCQVTDLAGTLMGMHALKMAEKAKSWELRESILGFATLNALSQIIIERNPENYTVLNGDLLDYIKLKKSDVVVLVGNIRPFVEPIRAKAKKLYILERTPTMRDENSLPDTACDQILPIADVILITGTAIVNGTIDHLLELSTNAREVAIVGASASIIPDILFERGATIVGCVKIVDSSKMMQVVSEGGGTPALKSAVDFISFKPKTKVTYK
jgi:uncharacterized protein (DUF4213/DUF364 family)